MFFSIEKEPNDNFSTYVQFGKLYLNIDNGWHISDNCVYKGYDENFCKFEFANNNIKISYPKHRSFPIFYDQNSITNLHRKDNTVTIDFEITNIDQNLQLELVKTDVIGKVDIEVLTENQVIENIYDILSNTIESFVQKNKLPIKAFLTGGVDSMLVYSFVKKFADVELIDCLHFDYDKFWCLNGSYIKENLWAYKQIHHYKQPCVLLSGTPGDEFMLRSPTTANLYLMNRNTNIIEQLENNDCLHRSYFSKYNDLFIQQSKNPRIRIMLRDRQYLYTHMCNMVLNDFQHWHLGNTLTYTPLRNLDIFKLLLRLPFESAVGQILDSTISKKLIERNDKSLLMYLSKQKNTNSFENVWKLY